MHRTAIDSMAAVVCPLSVAGRCSTQARSRLLEAAAQAGLAAGSVEVLFSGVDSGRVEAVLRAVPEGQVPYLCRAPRPKEHCRNHKRCTCQQEKNPTITYHAVLLTLVAPRFSTDTAAQSPVQQVLHAKSSILETKP